ncbi:LPS-assembly lipoprotein LptE [Hydrogenophaga laconesensis]|uniref:LPS-assembly lipoprotein LptE n=1 Tax=Hydrogenophaga laconesensis TaxID=1805971 RepID=A0ABU1VCW4_9BURK|nr:LPS assembly lipoprotein LptE [Hydrogenophaga laconesensis]MDR7095314.1 LPS-assembly lipoprotein [Hydrogenophaga laconesensis]
MQANAPLPSLAARRRALQQLAAGAAVLGLSGCGFALRKAPTFAFKTIRLVGSTGTPVASELRATLAVNGLQVVSGATPADVVLTVATDQRERIAVGQTAAGQVRELQLRTRFVFFLRTSTDKDLIENVELLVERDLSFTETAVLSKAAEEELLYRDMVSDIVQQVLRRLAAVKSL